MHADTEDCDFFGHSFFSLLDVFVGQEWGRKKWGRKKWGREKCGEQK
jgi:hypothetical protein